MYISNLKSIKNNLFFILKKNKGNYVKKFFINHYRENLLNETYYFLLKNLINIDCFFMLL